MILNHLKIGDTIGIVSPASPVKTDYLKKGVNYLKSLGFNIKEGKYVYNKWGHLAGSDEDRAKDLMNMFLDDSVDMILCTRGGYGSMRILPYLNLDMIKKNPKIFGGFSDITILLNLFYSQCDFPTFHCPMVSCKFEDEFTTKSFLNTIMNTKTPYFIKNPPDVQMKSITDEVIEGTLVGGNLSLICNTIGTPYEIDTKDKILFIEEIGEPPYKIDRMLTQLILSNKLSSCKGIIVGQFTNCTLPHYQRSLTTSEVIYDRIVKLNKPTLLNFMSGHSYPKLTLPIGAKIKLNCKNSSLEVISKIIK
ncbi:S66 peptidase family protein [Clostridium niameyense]|uniref:S66 peptidase family protein n=1 Tax=Clostridium niameyense TaxID=1622073 RepID=UPI00067F14A4|nr:LD-carboxypeptidase [Clostridium niameyense]